MSYHVVIHKPIYSLQSINVDVTGYHLTSNRNLNYIFSDIFSIMQMRVNSTADGKYINELTRRQHIFSSFMESFNTGIALPPIMVNYGRRIEALETSVKKSPETTIIDEKPADVDSLIETVDEPLIKECPHRARIEGAIKEMSDRITILNGIIENKDKEITTLKSSIIQLNSSLEDTIKRVHELSKQIQERSTISTEPSSTTQKDVPAFVTKEELKSTEKRIVKELTDKIDAELIDAEERIDEKIKASIETIKLAIDEPVGEEEEDGEEEEEDLDGVIDME